MTTDHPTPYYIVYEERLRRNLELISDVARQSGARIIMAFKANALWRTFDIIRIYNRDFTASSLNELQLGIDELGGEAHVYCPAYTESTIDRYLAGATHITFNSLDQFRRFGQRAVRAGVSTGLRVNPECSVIDTDIYNPALPGSRFGVSAAELGDTVPEGLDGFHFHALCESDSYDLAKVLDALEAQFGHLLPQLRWLNMGGGHLMTRSGYDIPHLIRLLRDFRERYPNLQLILEPGSAWTWRTGDLVTEVVDVVSNHGISTAIIDASFACHMPDCLEMPYKPAIAESMGQEPVPGKPTYRIGGNSCLSGDWVGDWSFEKPLEPGQRLTFEDMNHYTNVKTTMFNGIQHPAVLLARADGTIETLRTYSYQDYRDRMC